MGRRQNQEWARQPVNLPATSASEAVLIEKVLPGGKVWRRCVIEQAVAVNGASANLTTQLPAGARVTSVDTNNDTAIVFTTAVKFGVGFAADPDAFLRSAVTATKNTKNQGWPLEATNSVAAATTIAVTAVDVNGAAAGTFVGTVRVRIFYEYAEAIPNAA